MKIAVPLDGSPQAERVLPLVKLLLALPDAAIDLIHVSAEPTYRSPLPRLIDLPGGKQGSYLSRVAAQLGPSERLSLHVYKGTPADEIIRHAAEHQSSLIVLRPSSRGEVGGPLLSPVSLRILEACSVPILFVGPGANAVEAPLKRILIPTDGSEWSAAVLPGASALALAFGASATLFHAAPECPPDVGRFLEEKSAEFRGRKIESSVRLSNGDAATAIVTEAGSGKFDLVAMSTHGRSKSALPTGRVTEIVLRHCPVPVLTARGV